MVYTVYIHYFFKSSYAPWCPACRAITDTWNELGTWAGKDKIYSIGSVDVTEQPALNGRFMVTSLPTIYHVKNGEFRQYALSRSLSEFKKFLTEEEWRDVAPVSGWTAPSSALMNGISKLFTVSMELKSLHETLSSSYGLPGWVSFLLFGLLVIVVGLLLGVLLVFASDWIMGPPTYPSYDEHKKNDDAIDTTDEKQDAEDREEQEREKVETHSEEDDDDKESNLRQRKGNTDKDSE